MGIFDLKKCEFSIKNSHFQLNFSLTYREDFGIPLIRILKISSRSLKFVFIVHQNSYWKLVKNWAQNGRFWPFLDTFSSCSRELQSSFLYFRKRWRGEVPP